MRALTLSYYLADQNFERTKSLGILNLSVHLAEALACSEALQRFTIFANESLGYRMALPSGIEIKHFNHAADSRVGRVAWDQWRAYSEALRSGNEWLFLPKGFASFVRKPPIKLAVYVHDAMHDFYREHFPSTEAAFERWYFGKGTVATLRHARVIFTNSEFSRSEVRRLARKFGVAEPPIHVAGIGFRPNTTKQLHEKANRIVLLIGRWPHKRTDLAIPWMRRWQEHSTFAGEIHLVGNLPETINVPDSSAWRLHVRMNHQDYDELLWSARAVVYCSEYEGFGMPPVEAMLARACPVFSDLPATREVMREAGMRFSNESFDSFSGAMDEALAVSPSTIESWRNELLARHAWADVVRRVIAGLRELTAGP